MAVVTKTVLKGYFNDGDVPTESNYIDLIDTLGNGGTGASALADLTDVSFDPPSPVPAAGNILTYTGAVWVAGTPSSQSVAMNDLTDVDTTGVADGDAIVYDNASHTWKPVHITPVPVRQAVYTVSGTLAVQTGTLVLENHFGSTLTLVGVYLRAAVGPVGADIIIDVLKNGSTIFTTPANKPRILDGQTTGNTTTFDTASFANGDYYAVVVEQVGVGTKGGDLTVTFVFN